jgi:hypothetical protein
MGTFAQLLLAAVHVPVRFANCRLGDELFSIESQACIN